MKTELETIYEIEVTPDSGENTRLQSYKKKVRGKPDLHPAEPKVTRTRGDRLRVSGTLKIGAEDTGDGLVHGADGRSFYFVIDDPINNDAARLFVKEADVQIVRMGQVYTVKKGDTLGEITKKNFSNLKNAVDTVYEINKAVIGANPDLIYSGQKLFIPYNTH